MIVILDTDHLTAIQRRSEPACSNLQARLKRFSQATVCTSIINFEEQMRGWLSVIASATKTEEELSAYERPQALVGFFAEIRVIGDDQPAADRFAALWRLKLRIGSMDLKVAAIALASDALLASANVRDFGRVPGLHVEDWLH
jgi:tRNA(fMet)-specific endonuclease VapC